MASIMQERRREHLNTPHLASASGSIASFQTDMSARMEEIKIHFNPVQASGTPSPQNVLPITGWTGCDLNLSSNLLPYGYQQVEYIESTGTQYILINENFNQFIEFTVVCQSANISSTQIIVAQGARGGYWFGTASGKYGASGTSFSFDITDKIEAKLTYRNNNLRILIDDTVKTADYYAGDPRGLTLFGAQGTSSWFYSNIKIFSFSADGVVNLIPCYRISDGEVGMYDTVTKRFLTNSGTGTFIKGPDVGTTVGNQIPVSWSSAGTVYGGYANPLTGEGMAEWYKRTFIGDEYWTFSQGTGNNRVIHPIVYDIPDSASRGSVKFNYLRSNSNIDWDGWISSTNNLNIYVPSSINSVNAWKTYLADNPLDMCYKLATPIPFTFTPISPLKTLKGTNNIWSNANGNTEVKFWTH